MTKALISAFVLAFLVAGCGGGAQEAGPVPTDTTSSPPTSTGQVTIATTPETTPTTSTQASTATLALCEGQTSAIKVASQQGAAGTISTVWRVRNISQKACRSFGYPGMDFHTSSGWQNVTVHRGGFQNIDQAPQPVIVQPGHALYFVSYWNDVDTSAGPCQEFDRVKVTLPDNFVAVKLASSGCLNLKTVDVGPVASNPPA
jgi:hypothetical protein